MIEAAAPPVAVLETTSQTAYYFNFHVRDLGHFTVTGPSGSVSDASGSTQTTSWGEEQYHRVFAIEADQAGDYTINCASPFRVGDSLSTGGFIGMGVGAGLGCLAVVLMGIGLVLWLTRRKRA